MKNYLSFLLLFLSANTFAQIVPPSTVAGDNPSDIHWKYIETKAVKVIYPEGNEAEGTRVTNIINHICATQGLTVGEKRKHIDL